LGAPVRQAILYAFDRWSWTGMTCVASHGKTRRDALASLLGNSKTDTDVGHGIRLSEHLDGADGDIAFRHACKLGLEGIVANRRDRPYRSGRSPDWLKIKNPNAPAATRLIEAMS
jgi:bifunctional non-homologous end joining protein LigD